MSQKKPFKELFGKRVVISPDFLKPSEDSVKTKGGIELIGQAAEEEKEKEVAETIRFKILQVGDECHKSLKPGIEVHIEKPLRVVNPETVEKLFEDGELVGLIIAERDIAGIF